MRRPIFFDTETTGISAARDRIIEIAAYDPVSGKSFEQLINPGIPIPKEVIAVHQITDDMVKEAQPFAVVGKAFLEFCSGPIALIAHNGDAFDIPFITAEFTRNNLQMPSDWITIDTLKWARRYRKDLPRHSLQYLRQIYGIKENKAHRALNDVMILYEVYRRLVDDLTCDEVHALMQRTTPESVQQPQPVQQDATRQKAHNNPPLLLFS